MPLIYRVMSVENAKPLVANSARGLGVRFGDGPKDDLRVDAGGNVHPGKGMSVAPHWMLLPLHRIPRRLGKKFPEVRRATGKDQDVCWKMGEGPFVESRVEEGLSLFVDGPRHGMVGPSETMKVDAFLAALIATRELWAIDEE